MEPLQLFTLFLMAVAAAHLVFSATELLSRWLGKEQRVPGLMARQAGAADRSGGYVFFDPQDLYGPQPPTRQSKPAAKRETQRRTANRRAVA